MQVMPRSFDIKHARTYGKRQFSILDFFRTSSAIHHGRKLFYTWISIDKRASQRVNYLREKSGMKWTPRKIRTRKKMKKGPRTNCAYLHLVVVQF